VVSYNFLLAACQRARAGPAAAEILHEMERRGIDVNLKSVNLAMGALAMGGRPAAALALFDSLAERWKLLPNGITLTYTLKAAAAAKSWSHVQRALTVRARRHQRWQLTGRPDLMGAYGERCSSTIKRG